MRTGKPRSAFEKDTMRARFLTATYPPFTESESKPWLYVSLSRAVVCKACPQVRLLVRAALSAGRKTSESGPKLSYPELAAGGAARLEGV